MRRRSARSTASTIPIQVAAGRSDSDPSQPSAPSRTIVAQSLAVDVDLDVVAQRGGGVVEGDVDFAELGAEVLR